MTHKLVSQASFVSALVVIGLIASGCNSSTNPSGGGCGSNSTPNDSMSMQLDGNSWTSTMTTSTYNSGILTVDGQDGCNPNQILTFALIPGGTGTFTIGDLTGLNAILAIGPTTQWIAQPFVGGSGSVTISTLTATGASGTYSFTLVPRAGTGATGDHTVSSGSFNVKF